LNGDSYLVMVLIEGQSLSNLIQGRGRLLLEEALQISQDILDALDFAHRKGIIHRDVKPSNILVKPDGHAYLVDFGIALIWGKERITEDGVTIGTGEYMSPEQIRGAALNQHTDVYSFGCGLYEMLTGRPPFGGRDEDGVTDFTIKQGHLNKTPTHLRQFNSQVDEKTESVVLRALSKSSDERFGGCQEMAKALNLDFSVPSPPQSDGPDGHRKAVIRRGAVLGVIMATIVLIVMISHYMDPQDECGSVQEIARGSAEQMNACADKFYQGKNRLDDALVLWEQAWRQAKHGPSALAIAKMYDPVLWGKVVSIFSKPNLHQAKKWYKRAVNQNIHEAGQRLKDIENWEAQPSQQTK